MTTFLAGDRLPGFIGIKTDVDSRTFFSKIACLNFVLEGSSGLKRYIHNRKVSGSNSTRCSVGLRDLTSLRGSR